MAKFKVYFTHIEETKYEGWVEAESEHEARMMVEDYPFDVNELDSYDACGLEVIDIEVEELEEG